MTASTDRRCDAAHDGHDCTRPGECTRALLALLARCDTRRRDDETPAGDRRAGARGHDLDTR